MLMTHSDDDGFVAPPKVAPLQVVILPIFRSDEDKPNVLVYCHKVAHELRAQHFAGRHVAVMVHERDGRGGDKVWHWIKKGVPLRVEIGPRDMEKDALFVGRRDRAPKDKQSVPRSEFVATVAATLQSIQDNLYSRAADLRRQHTRSIDSKEEFYAWFTPPRVQEGMPTPIHGGFALTHFCGDADLEERIKNELGVTVRCIPLEKSEPGTCPFTGEPSPQRVVWAKAY
jgi:prolyl-tRNA synthetase